MKKVFALILTLALIASMAVASFAAVTTNASPDAFDEEKELTVEIAELIAADTVYAVVVAWDSDLVFNYKLGAVGSWDADNHQYIDTDAADWTDNDVTITVTNHSNADITAAVTVENKNNGTATVACDKAGAQKIDKAVEGSEFDSADAETFTLTASGAPASSAAIADVTVDIAAYVDSE